MNWFLIVLIIVLILIILLFWPLYIVIDFKKKENNTFNIQLTALKGLIKYKIYNEKKMLKRKKQNKNVKNKKLQIKKYLANYDQYKKIISFFLRKGSLKKLYWVTSVGTEDAALTGIYTGILWAIKNSIISIFINKTEVDEIYINVHPDFNNKKFEIIFNCIIKCNLVYIIIVSLYGFSIKKVVNKDARTSNRRINENYNE
ncbi:DUF2953 domain-containing protein [Anaerosalibacter bizertensis]|uniref:DUF2953 domain-containing protein n=1 Tax=Anaerosalibacter bizertensis TaxID=932217 RepID=A0A9Q4FK70_9FIRM|nr:DUF2953 domain-containing protein [Anaerosalibacter bizertensis]MBV1817417.1 DUF2953 domain-containing protein [Bacteroidales bacterium MSK.15.36]MCB5558497.1 DUF2953 domain-containing protein [Anaerosalibacter bizertensis]MCG4564261.1 DUF2953 domain-containing protein [Anaerosalibacter bizertensis]MCG4581692.1 DUF2953 domain-containing protein [Anaerosalibacter bizertensis]